MNIPRIIFNLCKRLNACRVIKRDLKDMDAFRGLTVSNCIADALYKVEDPVTEFECKKITSEDKEIICYRIQDSKSGELYKELDASGEVLYSAYCDWEFSFFSDEVKKRIQDHLYKK